MSDEDERERFGRLVPSLVGVIMALLILDAAIVGAALIAWWWGR